MAETMEPLKTQSIRWKAAFEEKGLEFNNGMTKVMKNGGGREVVVLAKIDPWGVCGKRTKVNCVKCETCKWVQTRYDRRKKVS